MPSRTTARVHILPAKGAPVAVILRRKPSKCFHVMKWDTRTGRVEHGSWFLGKLYPLRCDLSFDGRWMVYLAMGARGNTWTGLCQPPWLKTVWDAPNTGTWYGGGYWPERRLLLLNGHPAKVVASLPFKTRHYRTGYGEDEGVLYPRMTRDGWQRAGPLGPCRELKGGGKYRVVCESDPGWSWRPTSRHPVLRAFYRGYLAHGHTFQFGLDRHPNVLDRDVDWATWDCLGQLLVARGGAVERWRLPDLAAGRPSFRLDLEDLKPPAKPDRGDRRSGEEPR
jgi:hypothetical protein